MNMTEKVKDILNMVSKGWGTAYACYKHDINRLAWDNIVKNSRKIYELWVRCIHAGKPNSKVRIRQEQQMFPMWEVNDFWHGKKSKQEISNV